MVDGKLTGVNLPLASTAQLGWGQWISDAHGEL